MLAKWCSTRKPFLWKVHVCIVTWCHNTKMTHPAHPHLRWCFIDQTAQKICTLWFQFFGAVFASKGYPFKNIFDFTTAGVWYCVAAVERLPALHYSVDFIFLSFGIMDFIVELKTTRGSLMKSKWQKLASLAQKICTPWFQFFGAVFASKGYPFKNIFKWLLYFKEVDDNPL